MSASVRILTLVPNGASTDNRVLREAESLKADGHEVLLVGLRLPNLPGREALTTGGVKVRRIDWQYNAFSQIATIYAAILLPVLAILLVAVAVGGWYLYRDLLTPFASALFDIVVGLLGRVGNSLKNISSQLHNSKNGL